MPIPNRLTHLAFHPIATGLMAGGLAAAIAPRWPAWATGAIVCGLAIAVSSAQRRHERAVARGIQAIASGDLTWRPAEDGVRLEPLVALTTRLNAFFVPLNSQVIMAGVRGKEQAAELSRVDERAADEHAAVERISRHMAQIAGSSSDVTRQVDRLKVATDVTASSIEELTGSVAQVARNAQEMRNHAQHLGTAIGGIIGSSERMAESVQSALGSAENLDRIAQDSHTVLQRNTDSIDRLGRVVESSSHAIRELAEQSQRIGAMTEVIDDIADRTNLLALNAAIEAARAGEHGRGFAVVADEVRKLAESTSRSTLEIEKVVSAIQTDTKRAIAAIEEGAREVAESHQAVRETEQAFDEISRGVGTSVEQMQKVHQLSLEQRREAGAVSSTTALVLDMIAEVSTAVSEQEVATRQIMEATQDLIMLANTVSGAIRTQEKAHDDISRELGQTEALIEQNSQQIRSAAETSIQVARLMDEVRTRLAEMKIAAVDEQLIDLAIGDHLLWVARLDNMRRGNEVIRPEAVTSHRDCRLGKWYVGAGSKTCGGYRSFQQVDQPHARLHEQARRMIELFQAGQLEESDRVFTELQEISRTIVSHLTTLKQQIGQPGQVAAVVPAIAPMSEAGIR